LENRTGWLPKNDMLDILNGLFSQINIYGGSFETFPLEDKELIRLKQNLLSQLRRIHVREPEGMNKQFLKSLGTFLENNPHSFNVADLKSRKFEADSLPMNKGYEAPPELAALWNEFRSGIVELCEKEALALFNCYIDIFREVYAYFRDYARNDDVVFMEELNKQAQVLFEEAQVSVPELYYRLASRFQHFLIDEFQDTSKLQWSNVFLMIEDALATGGSLFYVGDKKQAIYRFRGGDVGLFENIKTAFKQFNVDDSVRLNTNFRSQKEIVSFNNEVFSPENLRRFLEIQQGAEKEDLRRFSSSQIDEIVGLFHDSEQKHIPRKPHGYVRIEHVRYADKEDRDELIRERLITAVRFVSERFPLKSIAILCRSNREIELVTEWLSAEKISVESERTLTIMNNPLIRELTAFLQFLHSPVDTIAFSAFILGDIFLTGTGMRREEITDFIFRHNRRESPGSGYLYRAFRKQYPRVWDTHIVRFF
jgi:ATP-dependent exoDNAse (exonuclease V) beta subunit (contains helicase and exonuclease domains)